MDTVTIVVIVQLAIIGFVFLCLVVHIKLDNLRRDVDSLKRDLKRLEDRSWEKK